MDGAIATVLKRELAEAEETMRGMRNTIRSYEQLVREAGGTIFMRIDGELFIRWSGDGPSSYPDPKEWSPLEVTAFERRYAWPEIAMMMRQPGTPIDEMRELVTIGRNQYEACRLHAVGAYFDANAAATRMSDAGKRLKMLRDGYPDGRGGK